MSFLQYILDNVFAHTWKLKTPAKIYTFSQDNTCSHKVCNRNVFGGKMKNQTCLIFSSFIHFFAQKPKYKEKTIKSEVMT